MAKKKTFAVEELKESINMKLAIPELCQARKEALACLLEDVLHRTGNYEGYNTLFPWNSVTKEYQNANAYTRRYY